MSRSHLESGQAVVEAALTLPLVVFLILGTIQLFMLLQARIVAQYAVYQAVRAGALGHGDCVPMTHSAVVAVLPTITRTDNPEALAEAFLLRRDNRYAPADGQHDGPIVEMVRLSPEPDSIQPPEIEDNNFDQGDEMKVLTVRMLYWYRLRIPFADWVIGRMVLAHLNLRAYNAVNPLLPTEQNAGWPDEATSSLTDEGWPGGSMASRMLEWSDQKRYMIPIRVTSSMRMMVPAKRALFPSKECPL